MRSMVEGAWGPKNAHGIERALGTQEVPALPPSARVARHLPRSAGEEPRFIKPRRDFVQNQPGHKEVPPFTAHLPRRRIISFVHPRNGGCAWMIRKAVRVGAYAAGYATIGFWQGLGWSLTGAGATLVTVALGVIFHYSIIIIGVVIVAAVALYTWRKPQGRRLTQLDLPGMGSAGPIAATADRLATLVRRWPGSLWHALNNDPALWWMPLLPWRFRSKRG